MQFWIIVAGKWDIRLSERIVAICGILAALFLTAPHGDQCARTVATRPPASRGRLREPPSRGGVLAFGGSGSAHLIPPAFARWCDFPTFRARSARNLGVAGRGSGFHADADDAVRSCAFGTVHLADGCRRAIAADHQRKHLSLSARERAAIVLDQADIRRARNAGWTLIALRSLRSLVTLGALRSLCPLWSDLALFSRHAHGALWTLRSGRPDRTDFALRTIRPALTGDALRALRTDFALRTLRSRRPDLSLRTL